MYTFHLALETTRPERADPTFPTAVGVMIYALSVYQRRAKAIRERSGAPYDDRFGPVSFMHCS